MELTGATCATKMNGDMMFGFFKKDKKELKQVASELNEWLGPQPGEKWGLRDGSPWPKNPIVKIREVKDGWVRYSMGSVFDDERLCLGTFVRIYQRLDA